MWEIVLNGPICTESFIWGVVHKSSHMKVTINAGGDSNWIKISINHSRNEKCDDGNAVNGDGCDLMCKVEEFFRCSGNHVPLLFDYSLSSFRRVQVWIP